MSANKKKEIFIEFGSCLFFRCVQYSNGDETEMHGMHQINCTRLLSIFSVDTKYLNLKVTTKRITALYSSFYLISLLKFFSLS